MSRRSAEERLNAELKKLVEAELLFEQGDSASTSYRFKHALIQEAAYQSLVREPRQHYHRKIAETLKERFLGRRGDPARAPRSPLRQRGSSGSRNSLSQGRGREVDAALGEPGSDRPPDQGAGTARTPCRRVPSAFNKSLRSSLRLARLSSRPKGSLLQRWGRSMRGLAKSASWRARRHSSFRFGGDCGFSTPRGPSTGRPSSLPSSAEAWANAANDPDLLMLAHHAAGVTLSALGRHADALRELEQAIAIHDPERHASTAFAYGQDSGVVCRSQAAFSLWFLGYPDQARRMNEEAVALAERLNHPYSLAAALDFSAWVDQLRGDSEAARSTRKTAIAISSKHDFVFWLLTGMILHGWALTNGNEVDEGVAQMRQALAGYEQTGAGILRPYYLALLADVFGARGEKAEAFRLLDEAEVAVRANGECWWEAELYRLKGELTLQSRPKARSPTGKSC